MDERKPSWKIKSKQRGHARALRKNSTEAERFLWAALRRHRLADQSFRRQVPIGGFIADFVCHAAKLVIEVDGGQDFSDQGKASDRVRTLTLQRAGFRVLRFSNADVLTNRSGVLEMILVTIEKSPHPNPPPQAGEGAISHSG